MKAVLVIISVILFGNVLFKQTVVAEGWEHITHVNGEGIGLVFAVKSTPDESIVFGGSTGMYEMNEEDIVKITDFNPYYFAFNLNGDIYTGRSNKDIEGNQIREIIKLTKSNDEYVLSIFFEIPDSFPNLSKFAADSQGNVWAKGYPDGLYRIDSTGDYKLFNNSNGLHDNYIHDIHVDSYDRVWICYGDPVLPSENTSNFGGVSMYSDGVWTTFNESDGLLSNRVFDIESNNKTVFITYWDANTDGISGYADSTWSLVIEPGYFHLCTDINDTLWYHLSPLNLIGYLHADGTSGSIEAMPHATYYYDLAVGDDGTICVGTTNGILKHPPLVTSVESDESKPKTFEISVYSNPFNPSTTISYSLTMADHVELSIYNLSGQKVATLVNSSMPAGTHHATFDGSNLASGMYFYRFEAGNEMWNGKMMLMK